MIQPEWIGENLALDAPLRCPRCGSEIFTKDGWRHLNDGRDLQRLVCRKCKRRFSDLSYLKDGTPSSSVTVSPEIAQKLVEAESAIAKYVAWLSKQGYAEATIEDRIKIMRRLVRLGGDIYDPESIKTIIAEQEGWCEGRKEVVVDTYTGFLRAVGGVWDPPRYHRIARLPFIPTEQEIDQLIVGCKDKTAMFLQLLKETGMRAGEAWGLRWVDIDFINKTVSITPTKRSNPRMLRISDRLLGMLKPLSNEEGEFIFGGRQLQNSFAAYYRQQRTDLAAKLVNPRLKRITFHTFRHWKATMEYHKTKDILHVMQLLGHKSIKNTLLYTHLVTFEGESEFMCKAAETPKEVVELIEAGFEYVCDMNNTKLFRKKK